MGENSYCMQPNSDLDHSQDLIGGKLDQDPSSDLHEVSTSSIWSNPNAKMRIFFPDDDPEFIEIQVGPRPIS